MDNCVTNSDGMNVTLNGDNIDAEGYVLSDNRSVVKLVNRREFSYHNFLVNNS